MSQYLTLYPGDVLWLGTDGDPENMKDGDVVEVEINGTGPAQSGGARALSTAYRKCRASLAREPIVLT
jgi:hypothetical protein